MDFSNREIAIYIWLMIGLLALFATKPARQSFKGVVSAFFQPAIMACLACAALYVCLEVSLLAKFDILDASGIKTTILWTVTFAFATLFDLNRITEEKAYFSNATKELISLTAVLTFIAEMYSFNFWVEFITVPLVFILASMQVLASQKKEHENVAKFLANFIATIGFGYLFFSLYQTVNDFDSFLNYETLRSFFLPIVLSFLYLPFLYCLMIYTVYETAFIGFNWSIKDKKLRWKAKWLALFYFGPRVHLFKRWAESLSRFTPDSMKELWTLVKEVKAASAREKNPPDISVNDGWSPYLAKELLRNDGLATRDYNRTYENEWTCSSNYLEIDSGLLRNNIGYYLSGNKLAVTELKLILNINNPKTASNAEGKFYEIAFKLIDRALSDTEIPMALDFLAKRKDFNIVIGSIQIQLETQPWQGGIPDGYSLKITINKQID